ncbi:MAG TPA: PIN domain-containing protein [Caulobacteraceae bacterium]|nr:PIN domain-containing protein [Caulobacteraceae bacterium]
MIDTNVAIHLRDGDPAIRAKMDTLGTPPLLSIVSRVELENGVNGVNGDPAVSGMRLARLDLMLAVMSVTPFDDACADAFRLIMTGVAYSRRKLLDRMIAAQAMVHNATLVTMNASDFNDIPNLKVVGW